MNTHSFFVLLLCSNFIILLSNGESFKIWPEITSSCLFSHFISDDWPVIVPHGHAESPLLPVMAAAAHSPLATSINQTSIRNKSVGNFSILRMLIWLKNRTRIILPVSLKNWVKLTGPSPDKTAELTEPPSQGPRPGHPPHHRAWGCWSWWCQPPGTSSLWCGGSSTCPRPEATCRTPRSLSASLRCQCDS